MSERPIINLAAITPNRLTEGEMDDIIVRLFADAMAREATTLEGVRGLQVGLSQTSYASIKEGLFKGLCEAINDPNDVGCVY